MRRSWVEQYRLVLKNPGVRPVFALGFILKLAVIAIPIVLTLHVAVGLGKGLGTAGLAVSAWLIGVTAGSPLQGAAIDRWGLRPALLLSATAQGVFWEAAPLASFPVLLAGAAVSGVLLIPGSTPVRLAITTLIPAGQRQTGFAVDSMLTELSYIAGPALGALATTQISSTAAMRGLGCAAVIGGISLAMLPHRPGEPAAGPPGKGASPDRWMRLTALLACVIVAGAATGGFEISLVGLMRSAGAVRWIGLLLSACGAYALVGGFVFGASRPAVRTWITTLLLGLVVAPLGWVGDWRVLLVAVAPAAVLSAVTLAAAANEISGIATAATRGRVMSVYGAALAGGNAVGSPLAGIAVSMGGTAAGFVTVGGVAIAVSLAARLALQAKTHIVPAALADDNVASPARMEN